MDQGRKTRGESNLISNMQMTNMQINTTIFKSKNSKTYLSFAYLFIGLLPTEGRMCG